MTKITRRLSKLISDKNFLISDKNLLKRRFIFVSCIYVKIRCVLIAVFRHYFLIKYHVTDIMSVIIFWNNL